MTLRSTRARVTGFTLVELLITLMIATILTTLAVPQFRSLVASNRLTTQSNDVIAAINFARSTAIKRNGSVFLCRAASDTATDCVTSQAQWTHWIVRTGAGNVIRRGTINTHGGKLRVTSELTNDTVEFGADGLGRQNGALFGTTPGSAATDCTSTTKNCIKVCTSSVSANNKREVVLAAGSRISTKTVSGTCP
jgi:type IV fimbrial biogenesis protein FimT